MGSVFIPLYDYDLKTKKWRKFAWIGPEGTLRPEPRKSLSSVIKREIMVRQKNQCRFCKSKITLKPYCNADADHIIPINYGGKTNMDNIQLLCVGCHRHKTSLENQHEKRIVYIPKDKLNLGETIVVYSSKPDLQRPLDMRNPVDISEPTGSETPVLLSYKKRRVGVVNIGCGLDDLDDLDESDVNIFDKYRYMG